VEAQGLLGRRMGDAPAGACGDGTMARLSDPVIACASHCRGARGTLVASDRKKRVAIAAPRS